MTEHEYDPDVDYALMEKHAFPGPAGVDPFLARWDGNVWFNKTETWLTYKPEEVIVLGRWTDRAHPLVGAVYAGKTWAEIAELKLADKIRRRDLDGRLAKAGIRIDVPRGKHPGGLMLNYEELDKLLTLAGF